MTRLIKKYKNRRLYDTAISQYITIDELQRYVLDGIAFKVEDSKTSADITSATLLQIVVEMESHTVQFFSADMLRQLILIASHPANQPFKALLEHVFSTMEKPASLNPYQSAADAWQKNVDTLLKQWGGFFKE